MNDVQRDIIRLDCVNVKEMIGVRRCDANKGDNGKGLLLAGSRDMTGAALMCAAAAVRAGIGTLKVLTPSAVRSALCALPEVMCHGFGNDDSGWEMLDEAVLNDYLRTSSCVGVGPGMGGDDGVIDVVRRVLSVKLPTAVDADALNALSRNKEYLTLLHNKSVITPHIGEMARLIDKSVDFVKSNMISVAADFANRHNCTVILKSSESVIASYSGECAINTSGNAGLAKGGSGDVLTGIVLAFLGQGIRPFYAACAGSFMLGQSADNALALLKERALIARDVISALKFTVNSVFDAENT